MFLASNALLLSGICGAIAKDMTRGPTILGYVSTMTRDDPYIDLPPESCTLDCLKRTRLLKDVSARLQDFALDDAVGHIAFGSAETFRRGKLRMDRLYG